LLKELCRAWFKKGYNMDQYEVDNAIASLSKAIDDLTYRLYTLEDSMAQLNAYVEEEKGEHIDG
jgi:hypothetical protein